MSKKATLPPYLQRSLLVLIIFLMGISVARLLVSMHQQQERIDILEAQVQQLLSDSTRLQIPAPQYADHGYYTDRGYSRPRYDDHSYSHSRPHYTDRSHSRTGHTEPSHPDAVAADSTLPATSSLSTERTRGESRTGGESPKFTTPHLLDLNTVDSLTLIRIPGIAGRTASVILKYRQRYGGFTSPRQLSEFLTWEAAQDYMDEWCTVWFTVDTSRLRRIPLNSATISELQRHPYISHEQAIELVRYRTRHRRFSDAAELQQLTTFTPSQLQQLLPYLSFE